MVSLGLGVRVWRDRTACGRRRWRPPVGRARSARTGLWLCVQVVADASPSRDGAARRLLRPSRARPGMRSAALSAGADALQVDELEGSVGWTRGWARAVGRMLPAERGADAS